MHKRMFLVIKSFFLAIKSLHKSMFLVIESMQESMFLVTESMHGNTDNAICNLLQALFG